MSIVSLLRRAACAAVLLVATACGSSSTPTAPTPPAPPPPVATTTVTYSGLFGSGMFTGTVTLTAVVPTSNTADTSNGPLAIASATGTAKFSGASKTTINLTGTFDTTTNKFTLTSAGWSIDATVTNNRVTGTISTPVGGGGMAALVTTASNPTVSYCGNYVGTESGKFLVTTGSGFATGVAAENGIPGAVTLAGTVNGNSVSLSWSWTDGVGGQGVATGTINGTSISGTWSNTDGQSGTWSGSAGC
jgi:hypothetical protein